VGVWVSQGHGQHSLSCVCVCVSVTLRHCIKMAKHRITPIIMPHDSPGTLVFWRQRWWQNSNGDIPYKATNVGEWVKIGQFWQITYYKGKLYQVLPNRWKTTRKRGVVMVTWRIKILSPPKISPEWLKWETSSLHIISYSILIKTMRLSSCFQVILSYVSKVTYSDLHHLHLLSRLVVTRLNFVKISGISKL